MPEDLPGYDITQSDVEFALKKLGLSIPALRRERVQKERDDSLARAQAHHQKHLRAQAMHEEEMIQQFFKRQGKTFFVFLNGREVNIKKLDESVASCPVKGCSGKLPAIKGWVLSLIDKHPTMMLSELSAYGSILCVDTDVCCNGTKKGQPKHLSHLQVQQLLPG